MKQLSLPSRQHNNTHPRHMNKLKIKHPFVEKKKPRKAKKKEQETETRLVLDMIFFRRGFPPFHFSLGLAARENSEKTTKQQGGCDGINVCFGRRAFAQGPLNRT